MLSLKAISSTDCILCPFCKSSLHNGLVSRCFVCRTPHHADCWRDHDFRCSVFQCTGNQTLLARPRHGQTSKNFRLWLLACWSLGLALLYSVDYFEWVFILPRDFLRLTGAICIFVKGIVAIRKHIQALPSISLFAFCLSISIFLALYLCSITGLFILFSSCH